MEPNQHQSAPMFEDRTQGATHYRGVTPALVSPLKGSLIGWKVRSESSAGGTDIATVTPYLESTGPRDPGDAYRWTDARADAGQAIIVIPPAGWAGTEPDPIRALMDLASGEMSLIATRDADILSANAERGFVLYEPAQGWVGAGGGPGGILDGKTALTRVAIFSVAALAGYGLVRLVTR